MEVIFDTYAFRMQAVGGISRYFSRLAESYATDYADEFAFSFCEALPPDWAHLSQLVHVNQKNGKQSLRLNTEKRMKKSTPSILHLTYYQLPQSSVDYSNIFLTLHDFAPEDNPEFFPDGNPHLGKIELMKKSTGLICVSNFTAERAIAYMPSAENRIVVVPHATDFPSLKSSPLPVSLQNVNYILVVGRPDIYKNIVTAVRVWLHFKSFKLVLFGCTEIPKSIRQIIPFWRLADIHLLSGDDALLKSLYKNAVCLLNTSLYEGFSLPILEAISVGCPVVASPLSVYKDIYGDVISYSQNTNVSSYITSIQSLLENPAYRQNQIEKGIKHSLLFNWDKTILETINFYKTQVVIQNRQNNSSKFFQNTKNYFK